MHLILNVAIAVTIALAGGLVAHWLRQSVVVGYLLAGVVIGPFTPGVIAISSTMVILKALLDRGEVAASHGRVLLGMLIVQDLAVVVLIVLLPKLAAGAGVAAGDLAATLVKAVAFIAATLFLGARVV